MKAARNALDKMIDLRKQQELFLPYLTGYVALYLGDADKALADLEQANGNDAFIKCLKAEAYEKLGEQEKAKECYRTAAATRGHNSLARKKLS